MTTSLIVLEGFGMLAFALSGASMAVRKNMDLVGMFVLASITAVGGGVSRDLLLDIPVAALRTPWWWAIVALATAVVFFFHDAVQRSRRAVLIFDAVGLGQFCVTSTALALGQGLGPFEAILIGVMGGTAGGVMRDVLAGEIPPSILRRGTQLYAVPAVVGCGLVVLAHAVGLVDAGFGDAGLVNAWVLPAAGALIVVLRLLALWRGWQAPAPQRRDGT